MDARNTNETRNRWATAVRTATVAVVLGTLAAVWHPAMLSHAATATSNDTGAAAAAPDMSVYFPARFPAPENVEQQAPTF